MWHEPNTCPLRFLTKLRLFSLDPKCQRTLCILSLGSLVCVCVCVCVCVYIYIDLLHAIEGTYSASIYSTYTSKCTRVSHGLPHFYFINACVRDTYFSLLLQRCNDSIIISFKQKDKVHRYKYLINHCKRFIFFYILNILYLLFTQNTIFL